MPFISSAGIGLSVSPPLLYFQLPDVWQVQQQPAVQGWLGWVLLLPGCVCVCEWVSERRTQWETVLYVGRPRPLLLSQHPPLCSRWFCPSHICKVKLSTPSALWSHFQSPCDMTRERLLTPCATCCFTFATFIKNLIYATFLGDVD